MSITRAKIYLRGLISGSKIVEDMGKVNTADDIKRQCEKILKELEDETESPWISINDEIPAVDEEVIAMTDNERICFAHIVDKSIAKDYDGWNIPDIAFWMPYTPSEEMKEFYDYKEK